MPRSEESKKQQYAYSREYQAKNINQKKLILNQTVPEDMKILNWIDSQPEGTSPYLKRLVQEDMSRAASQKSPADL